MKIVVLVENNEKVYDFAKRAEGTARYPARWLSFRIPAIESKSEPSAAPPAK